MTVINTPDVLYAGESLSFEQKIEGFTPADGYSLEISISNGTSLYKFDGEATLDNLGWKINVLPSITLTIVPTTYSVIARVKKVADNFIKVIPVNNATIEVKPDPFSGNGLDNRSYNKRMVDALRACIEGTATSNIQEYTINNRQIKYMSRAEQLKNLLFFENRLKEEEEARITGEFGSRYIKLIG